MSVLTRKPKKQLIKFLSTSHKYPHYGITLFPMGKFSAHPTKHGFNSSYPGTPSKVYGKDPSTRYDMPLPNGLSDYMRPSGRPGMPRITVSGTHQENQDNAIIVSNYMIHLFTEP